MAGAINLEVSIQTGNVELILIESAARVDYLGKKIETFVLGRSAQGWERGERIANDALLHWRYGYRTDSATFP